MSLFPFDPLGTLLTNKIVNEIHTITSVNGIDHNYFVPKNAPFYGNSISVIDATTGQTLILNQDYHLGYIYQDATDKVGQPIYGSIAIVDPNRVGNFYVNYQTLGGEYVNEESQTLIDGLETLDAILNPDWTDLVNVPTAFPPTPHMLRLDNVVGVANVIAELQGIQDTILNRRVHIRMDDIVDFKQEYTQPLLDTMDGIASAVAALSASKSIFYVDRTDIESSGETTFPSLTQWLDIPVSYTAEIEGSFLISVSNQTRGRYTPYIVIDGVRHLMAEEIRPASLRFVINGNPVSTSELNSAVIGLAQGDTLSLQVRPSSMYMSSIILPLNMPTCGFTLIKLSD